MPPSEILKLGGRSSTCRQSLRTKFEAMDDGGGAMEHNASASSAGDRSVLSMLSLNDSTRKALRNGAERISKTFNNVRTTLGSLSQKFRVSTKRRQILEEGPMTPNCSTPRTSSKVILGRTPTKLYSPFGIDTPYKPTTTSHDKENQHLTHK